MTTARKEIVDPAVTRWYHCISRCVRGGYLLSEQDGLTDRKQWIEDRLEFLAGNFAIAVGGFAILDNHLHVLLRLDPDDAELWTADQVVRRWMMIYPPESLDLDNERAVAVWVENETRDAERVQTLRERLQNLSWFMKSLKEPLSRLANQQDHCRGTFWEKRFKSIAILDTEALLATSIYIDLNVFAAGLAETPESSPHTSLQRRVIHVQQQDQLESLTAAEQGSIAGSKAAGNIEQGHWLVPIEDRRSHTNSVPASTRAGMLESLSLGSYLLLVDYTSRLFRTGKANLNAGVTEIFERLESNVEIWNDRIRTMLGCRELRGTFFAADQQKIREHSSHCGKRRANLRPQLSTAPAG